MQTRQAPKLCQNCEGSIPLPMMKGYLHIGSPFVVLNTCTGALMVYGLAGLRNEVAPIFIYMAIMSLHALVSNQLLVTCIWMTPTQVCIVNKCKSVCIHGLTWSKLIACMERQAN